MNFQFFQTHLEGIVAPLDPLAVLFDRYMTSDGAATRP